MQEKKFLNGNGQEKSAYELTSIEFSTLIKNLRLYGDLAKMAITLSNDKKTSLRPRLPPAREAVEILQEVLKEKNIDSAEIGMTELDILRADRAEISQALRKTAESGLTKKLGGVTVGLPTMASAMNDLRGPLMEGTHEIAEPILMQNMLHQFHEDGLRRIMDSAQPSGL